MTLIQLVISLILQRAYCKTPDVWEEYRFKRDMGLLLCQLLTGVRTAHTT